MFIGAINGSAGPAPQPGPQRASGSARMSCAVSRGASRLVDLAQSGSARLMLPRVAGPRPEAVFLNTSGGLTSGDQLSCAFDLAPGSSLTATTQTAERAYLAPTGPARFNMKAQVGADADLAWLPQETILFEGSNLVRRTEIALSPGAFCLTCEIIVLGRRAMGEILREPHLRDHRRVTMAGRPLWFETQEITPASLAFSQGPAGLGQAPAFATLALCGQGAESVASLLRAEAAADGVEAAVSGWNGRSILRAMAADLWPLKCFLGRVVARLTGRPLPRVWQMTGVSS